MSAKKPKVESGGARLMAGGKKPVLLGPSIAEWKRLKKAAEFDGRPITQFLLHHGLMLADKIIEENQQKSTK